MTLKRFLVPVLLCLAAVGRADDKLPFVSPMFTDHMVLQRDRQITVWGWTQPGEHVTAALDSGPRADAVAGSDGKWVAHLRTGRAGGPHSLHISGSEKADFSDVLYGDVWICSGQSNMEMGIGNVNNAANEIAGANYPDIRLYTVKKATSFSPVQTVVGHWDQCSPATVAAGGWNGFSAVAYFFGRRLYNELKIPIGLVHTSWGGTIAEAWTSTEGLAGLQDFTGQTAQVAALAAAAPGAKPSVPVPASMVPGNPNVATVLYNAMIAPVIPYAIKGAIWYQGESNAGRAYQYRTLLPAMIADWRSRWQSGSFPFYIVQLANFQALATAPTDDSWAELREAQSMTARRVPNTGIAVTTDIGDAADIHPKDKQTVGERLALNALAKVYKKPVEFSGPEFLRMKREGSAIRLSFDHAAGGLAARGGEKLQGFAIAGSDHKFHWADARIEGDTVVVSSPDVPQPEAVRYAWAINPPNNLINHGGLPASPFRTDDWPGITVNNH